MIHKLKPLSLLLLWPVAACAQGSAADYARAEALPGKTRGGVYRVGIQPEWLPGGTSLWYRVKTGPDSTETVFVDAVKGLRTTGSAQPDIPARVLVGAESPGKSVSGGAESTLEFHNELEESVVVSWLDFRGVRRAYGEIQAGQRLAQHTFAGHAWVVMPREGPPLHFRAEGQHTVAKIDSESLRLAREALAKHGPARPDAAVSPDGRWRIRIRQCNVFLEPAQGGAAMALSRGGTAEDPFTGEALWSPDSRHVAVQRVRSAHVEAVTMLEVSPRQGGRPVTHSFPYRRPGDPLPKPRVFIFNAETRAQVEVPDLLYPNPFVDWGPLKMFWRDDSRELVFHYNQRGHQVYRLLAADPATGAARVLAEEAPRTFVDYSRKIWMHWMERSNEMLWLSERDGWAHLYLMDTGAGKVKNQVTRGEWVVRSVKWVDEAARQVWFYAGGVRPGQNPYYLHLCRVNFDGSGFAVLTEGEGTHSTRFSPDKRWFVDTWSRVDLPPVTELRRASDGALVCRLETGDDRELRAAGWNPPERFHAPGRDGITPIYGILIRPTRFDPSRKYPVIEEIYAGPQDAFVPCAYGRLHGQEQLAELGFVVVQIDGMGTNHRSKAFHDVCWKNLGDAGFPDRIAWMKAAAKDRPWMDLSRVGIYGGSAGGQNAARSLIAHGDFYKAAAADCGCHDNRMDKIWWNEQWMGWPVGKEYDEASNIVQAGRLRGRLLLTVGELDRNVDPASTLRFAAELVRAGRDFELVILPSMGHGAGESPYASRRRMDFFVRSLHGVEPRHTPLP